MSQLYFVLIGCSKTRMVSARLVLIQNTYVSDSQCICWLLWSTTLLLPTLLSDSQISISVVVHGFWWTVSGQVKARDVLTRTSGVSSNHLPVTLASDRPCTTLLTCARYQNLKVGWIYSTKRMMMQSYGWDLQRLQHSHLHQATNDWSLYNRTVN